MPTPSTTSSSNKRPTTANESAEEPTDDRRDRVRSRERNEAVVEQYLAGVPVVDIGHQFGAATCGSALRLVKRALDERVPGFDAEVCRRVDNARLDRLLHAWWDRAIDGDPQASLMVIAIIEGRTHLGVDGYGPPGAESSAEHDLRP